MVVGLLGNKSLYSNRFTLVFQSLRMMYDYKLNLVVRTPRACPWESSVLSYLKMRNDSLEFLLNSKILFQSCASMLLGAIACVLVMPISTVLLAKMSKIKNIEKGENEI